MTSLQEVYALFLASSGVETDSRKLTLNQLFFALKGPNFDGNTFALKSLQKGAAAAIVDCPKVAASHEKCYLVDDVLKCLQDLANHHRNQFEIPVIGLTGSNGKTTTKELIAAVLRTKYNILATEGNLNNHIGVPLTLLHLTENHTHALIEMGANHLKEIDFLCQIANPTHGLITNVGKAHLEGFGSEEGVLLGKTELYRYVNAHNGIIFINQEDEKLTNTIGKCTKVAYNPSEFILLEDEPAIKFLYNSIEITTKLAGNYNRANVAAAVCVGSAFGVTLKNSVEAIEAYIPKNHRSQVIHKNGKTIVLDAYNANPTSMQAAVEAFQSRKGKKALVLGFMAELGSHENEEHKRIVVLAKSMGLDLCFWVGEAYKPFVSSNWFENTTALQKYLQEYPIDADQILVKGSRSAGLENILDQL